jgi:Cu2+-exporting ATPase
LRSESTAVVSQLRVSATQVFIWSGDALPAVRAVARELGVDGYEAGALPEHKLALMQALQAKGAVVAMVGDGVNDAPVLAQAQLSIALGSGALLSQAHADMVLLSGRLRGLLDGLDIATRTRAVIRQNLAWAVAYNVCALPLAAAGMVTPWLAGIGMGISSLVVVLNALRLTRFDPDRAVGASVAHPSSLPAPSTPAQACA